MTFAVWADLSRTPQIERTELSMTSPFGPFRERSDQRFIYNHRNAHTVTEFEYRHVIFKDYYGLAPKQDMVFQASLEGRNLGAPMTFKVGRVWAGNERFLPLDGGAWNYIWGKRLSTTLNIGAVPRIEQHPGTRHPSFFEGRAHYRFNEQAFFALQANQEASTKYSSFLLGYNIESLKLLGEFASTGATESWRLGLQYFDGYRCDLTSDYRVQMNNGNNVAIMRNLVALDVDKCYLEGGVGGRYPFGDDPTPKSMFYEGSVTWGSPRKGKDSLTMGYIYETSPASTSQTVSGHAERAVSKNTTLGITVTTTSFDTGRRSIQNLEGSLRRRVDWGYYEARFGAITGGQDDSLQREVGIRAGYEY